MTTHRLDTPQRTLYGVHRPKYYARRDPAPNVEFSDPFPPIQKWEIYAWSFIVGIVGGAVIFFPW